MLNQGPCWLKPCYQGISCRKNCVKTQSSIHVMSAGSHRTMHGHPHQKHGRLQSFCRYGTFWIMATTLEPSIDDEALALLTSIIFQGGATNMQGDIHSPWLRHIVRFWYSCFQIYYLLYMFYDIYLYCTILIWSVGASTNFEIIVACGLKF